MARGGGTGDPQRFAEKAGGPALSANVSYQTRNSMSPPRRAFVWLCCDHRSAVNRHETTVG